MFSLVLRPYDLFFHFSPVNDCCSSRHDDSMLSCNSSPSSLPPFDPPLLLLVPFVVSSCLIPVLVLLEAAAALTIRLLANVEWDVAILDHMPDLTFHRDGEQDAKVDE